MTTAGLLTGDLVRLAALNPETDAESFARWSRDSEYYRLDTTDPARMWSPRQTREFMDKDDQAEHPNSISLAIRTLDGDQVIGFIALDGIEWTHGDAWVGIGIGDRAFWGRGYGADAMRVMLRYAFVELNLFRVSLNVFEYNRRAIRSYEKCGFTVEGRLRAWIHRDGRLWDLIFMGILREEWDRTRA